MGPNTLARLLAAFSLALLFLPGLGAGSPFDVELLEPGKAPRRTLRLEIEKNQEQTLLMTMNMNIANGAGQPAMRLPTVQVLMRAVVTDVDPDGYISYKFEYTKMDVLDSGSEPTLLEMRGLMKRFEGTVGTAVISNRSITKSVDLPIQEDWPPQLRQLVDGMAQSLQQLSLPLPEEAVGAGARWRVSQDLGLSGFAVTQTSTYELTELTESSARTRVATEQKADPQDVRSSSLPAGIEMRLISLQSAANGEILFDLQKPLPRGTVEVLSEVAMQATVEGQEQAMGFKMEVKMKMEEE